ncbi:MAG: hypothetical protein J0H94_12185 [Rhizobiales bacterium]|nr:hypothetical protein [Hyphomicrobiales bacterium]
MRSMLVLAAAAVALSPAVAVAPALAKTVPPLSAYVGKYPYDKVQGVVFLKNPALIAAVKKAAPPKSVAKWVLSVDTTQVPIAEKDGKIIAHACEPHNCGDHQWAIVIDASSGSADVCYHNPPDTGEAKSRWYLSTGKNELRDGAECPSE